MQRKKPKLSTLIFGLFLVLLIIPETRTDMQVAMNKMRVLLFSPSTLDTEDQTHLDPFTYQVVDLEGNPISTKIGQGKVIFLSYWATWCPPCIAELPGIQELYDDYGDRIDFLLLTNEDPEVVRRFLEKKSYDLPVFIPRMQAPETLYDGSIPTNYIIDFSGTVIVKETGAADWDSERVRKILNALLE